MATWLKQSTAVDVMLGPFLDNADGNTVEGGLTITQPDIRLSKNGGTFAQKSAAQTLSHGEAGWYPCNLSTTDTNTLGSLVVAVHESGALPVWREFMVVPANVWDSFFSTDKLQVHVDEMTASIITSTVIANDALTAAKLAADVTTELQSGLATAANLTTVDTVVDAIKAKTDSLTFTVAGFVDANIQYINDVLLTGDGESGTEWGP